MFGTKTFESKQLSYKNYGIYKIFFYEREEIYPSNIPRTYCRASLTVPDIFATLSTRREQSGSVRSAHKNHAVKLRLSHRLNCQLLYGQLNFVSPFYFEVAPFVPISFENLTCHNLSRSQSSTRLSSVPKTFFSKYTFAKSDRLKHVLKKIGFQVI